MKRKVAADWDERYRRGEHATQEPHSLLVGLVENLEPGRALDVACGAGRHAIYLAEHGWRVTAVDASRVGIELAAERARERELEIDFRVADLERGEFDVEREAFELISVFYYLQRDLFPALRRAVRPGGRLVAAIHMLDERPGIKPMNPDYLLRPGELASIFRGWELEHYLEGSQHDAGPGDHARRTAELIARKVISDR